MRGIGFGFCVSIPPGTPWWERWMIKMTWTIVAMALSLFGRN